MSLRILFKRYYLYYIILGAALDAVLDVIDDVKNSPFLFRCSLGAVL